MIQDLICVFVCVCDFEQVLIWLAFITVYKMSIHNLNKVNYLHVNSCPK